MSTAKSSLCHLTFISKNSFNRIRYHIPIHLWRIFDSEKFTHRTPIYGDIIIGQVSVKKFFIRWSFRRVFTEIIRMRCPIHYFII